METNGKVFITGSTGFIGSKLVARLIERGFSIRGLARKPLESKPGIDYIQGDVTDIDSIRCGMDGCRYAFHLAAYAKNWSRNPTLYDDINIRGARNVFTVAKEYKLERLVWTSTVVTMGPTRPGEIGDEEMPRITEKFFTEYERSKTEMERESFRWVDDGLPLVTVNPTRVYGPEMLGAPKIVNTFPDAGRYRERINPCEAEALQRSHRRGLSESNTVSIMIDTFRKGRFPILLNRGVNIGNYAFIDDVVKGHILAMERGRIGERYILGGENVSLDGLFRTIERIDEKKRFQLKIYWIIPMLVAYVFKYRARLFGTYPPITPGWVRTFLADWAFSSEKAKRELGYQPLSLEEGLRKTCAWLSELDTKLDNYAGKP